MARRKCRRCHTNTNTYRINHVPYINKKGYKKAFIFGEWQNWCADCIKSKTKELNFVTK